MVLDYSKWDALELSDDSDIEVHPNVDKRSFIRAKQHQIHQQRSQRRHEIETLKYERIINDGLLKRIDNLLEALRKHEDSAKNPDEIVFRALLEVAGDPNEDQPPAPPAGVHTQEKEQPKYSQMMGSLMDQVRKEADEAGASDRFQAYIRGVEGHRLKVQTLQQELLAKLAELEKEESRKITSDSIHTGFDSSFVAKSKPSEAKKGTQSKSSADSVELLNPASLSKGDTSAVSTPGEGDVDEGEGDNIKPTKLALEFSKIKIGDYRACLQFISEHPEIVAERKTDELLIEAFDSQLNGNDDYARQCVHQGLLLQYCRSLGSDGIALFFKRITTKEHRASILFNEDVNDTYNKIRTRARELAKSSASGPSQVEQIQLHAVDPSTKISLTIPPANSSDPRVISARQIFDNFPTNLQRALESESLDEVNKILGKMSVEEAEDVVEKLGQSGILKLEEGIVDATTEEGKKRLEDLEAQGKREPAGVTGEEGEEEIGDPE